MCVPPPLWSAVRWRRRTATTKPHPARCLLTCQPLRTRCVLFGMLRQGIGTHLATDNYNLLHHPPCPHCCGSELVYKRPDLCSATSHTSPCHQVWVTAEGTSYVLGSGFAPAKLNVPATFTSISSNSSSAAGALQPHSWCWPPAPEWACQL